MLELQEPAASRRRSVRRAVRLETEVRSLVWEGPVSLLATDLSPEGMWLQTALPLHADEEVEVRLPAPGFPAEAPLTATARIARVGLYRRCAEAGKSGMGLAFSSLSPSDATRLATHLRGLPPPLPLPADAAALAPPAVMQPDPAEVEWIAAGPLLTAGRLAKGQAPSVPRLAEVIPLPTRAPLMRSGA